MKIEAVEYPAVVRLEREVVYERPDQFGMRPAFESIDGLWDEGTEAVLLGPLLERMPDDAWGFFWQERLTTTVEHRGEDQQLTSLPLQRSGTVYVDAVEVTKLEMLEVVRDQQEYVNRQRRASKAIGKMPHGSDKRPVLSALEAGERVVKTRNGHYRSLDTARGDSVVESSDPALVVWS